MHISVNSFLPLSIFLALLVLLSLGLGLDPRKIPSPLIDKPAPPFQLPQLSDPNKKLSTADFLGNVVLFNVWASWCGTCRYEHKTLVFLAKFMPIYGLNYKDEPELALAWLKDYGDPYVATAVDASGRIGIDWGVYGTPESFVIDQTGIVRYKHTGPLTEKDAMEVILPLLQKLQPPAQTTAKQP